MNSTFRSPVQRDLLFQGRPGDPRLGQWVRPIDGPLPRPASSRGGKAVAVLFGCPDDTGVVLNRGRQGARLGPDSVRKHFYKLAPPMDFAWEEKLELWDYGNIVPAGDIVETHRRAQDAARDVSSAGFVLVALGGGHDFAAPNFRGFAEGLGAKAKVGLINVDPHLDMRPLENGKPHSGTPFRQLLDSGTLPGARLTVFGARAQRNARDHYRYALDRRVTIHTLESLRARKTGAESAFRAELERISRRSDAVGVTFDIDACSDGEGTSAAPVVGFSAWEMCRFAALAGAQKKVRYLELAEVAPSLDPAERTSRIAAEMIAAFLLARARAK